MYLFGFGIACIPNPKGGSLRDLGGCNMTFKDLIQRVKQSAQETLLTKIRELLASTKDFPEHTVYTPRDDSRWSSILKETVGIDSISETRTAAVTGYATNATFHTVLENILKQSFNHVYRINIDEQGWRAIFVVAASEEDEPLLVCSNYYETSRESVKAQFNSAAASNSNTAADTDAEAEGEPADIDPFE